MERDEIRFRLLKLLEARPDVTQREVAQEFGISVGKINYCFRALIDKGYVNLIGIRQGSSNQAYKYFLTRKGLEAKAAATAYFLKFKIQEYERLKSEIESLSEELRVLKGKN